MTDTRSSGGDVGFNIFIGSCVAVLMLAVGGLFITCSNVTDIKKAVCAESFARAVTASDTLRVNRTEACDLPQRDGAH
jgi:hypothetical protein